MYHPAAALRQGSLKETMLADMAGVPEALLEARQRRAPTATVEPVLTTAGPASMAVESEPATRPESEAELELEAIAVLETEVAGPEPVLGLF